MCLSHSFTFNIASIILLHLLAFSLPSISLPLFLFSPSVSTLSFSQSKLSLSLELIVVYVDYFPYTQKEEQVRGKNWKKLIDVSQIRIENKPEKIRIEKNMKKYA